MPEIAGTNNSHQNFDPQVASEETGSPAKRTFTDPRLTFVSPKLTRAGHLDKLTGGFFGTFSP